MKVDLPAVLAGYSKSALAALAQHHGLAPPGTKKEDLVAVLATSLFEEERIKGNLATLGKSDRQVLDRLILRGGQASTVSFRRELLRTGLIVESPRGKGYYRDQAYRGSHYPGDSRYFEDVVARLSLAGLAFCSGLSLDYGGAGVLHLGTPGQSIFIPDEALAHLPPVSIPLPAPPAVADSDIRELAPWTLQRDLYLYWRFAGRNELALTARGFVPKRQVAKISEGLVVGEEVDGAAGEQELGRSYFLRRLLQDLGLLRHLEGRLLPAPETLAFLALPLAERVRRSYQAWLHSDRWNELLRLPGVTIDCGTNAHRVATPSPILKARQFVVALLAALPAGRWIPLAHLWERARLVDSDFLFPRDYRPPEPYYGYYGRRAETNPYERSGNALGWTFTNLKDDENGWRTVEGGFIAAVLREPLHWLGLVALGFEQDRLAAFRIGELGARLLRGEALPADASPAGDVVVQPNFQIFAFDPVGEHVLATLDRFAELVRAEQAVEFRLTRESVYRAQQENMSVAAIVAFLEAAGRRPLPQNVQRTLAEWASHHERIVVRRNVSLLHSADPALLDALLADDGLAPQLGRRLAPTAAVIACGANGLGPLATALIARGHLPAISREGNAVDKGAIAVAPDGRIAFQQRLPSIYVWRRLAPLAEQRDGTLWLTPVSVQRAIDGGLSAEQLIQQLADVHCGPLPAAVAERIKVWAKHWGDATLAAITLLRVKDDAVLAELMADPAIGPLLQPYVPQGAVALVRPADTAHLRAALKAKGIEVLDEG